MGVPIAGSVVIEDAVIRSKVFFIVAIVRTITTALKVASLSQKKVKSLMLSLLETDLLETDDAVLGQKDDDKSVERNVKLGEKTQKSQKGMTRERNVKRRMSRRHQKKD